MKRKKQYGHLKSAVLQAFEEGKTASEVIEFYGIPKSTIYDWLGEFRKSQKENAVAPKQSEKTLKPLKPQEPTPVEVLPPMSSGVNILTITKPFEEMSDFEIGRLTLRSIAINPDSREASRIQAAIALIRSVEIGNDLPKHVREGREETSIASERKKLEGMSVEELAREYKRMLEAT